MDILAYFLAVIIGISLGLVGGGGSILTVPVLVYLLHIDPLMATTYSLFIVGITSLVGGAKAYSKKLIDFRAVALFGIPSILSIFIARHFLLPAIPDYLFDLGNIAVTKDVLLMVVFALLMFAAAISMIRNELAIPHSENNATPKDSKYFHEFDRHEPSLVLVLPGLLIGLITGLLGAGGGFLIIPTLVLIIRMPMKIAVGTSLLIVSINSLFGFVFSIGITPQEFNWPLMLIFSLLAVIGIIIGSKLSDRIPGEILKKAFGWFILIMGVYILIRELWL
ncbi:sulfite exporter TauE/SafE family protein [Flavitalea sp.]|nr:sulfite exporter TauE/SafE family protein [Flavitalea sp.]